ncbi:MAG: carbamoyl phosphate synthase large subunit, partial [Prolixibacteraceae bacterium]|nr:carbamoyl phosphate synthase large subunit [Prolixibacteraceae bacterium]
YRIPEKNVLFSSGPSRSKVELLSSARLLQEKGYNLFATEGTHRFFHENGIMNTLLHWPDEEDRLPNTIEYIMNKKIDLVVNIPKNYTRRELANGYKIRRCAIDYNVPLITNSRVASAFIYGICKYDLSDLSIKSWDQY